MGRGQDTLHCRSTLSLSSVQSGQHNKHNRARTARDCDVFIRTIHNSVKDNILNWVDEDYNLITDAKESDQDWKTICKRHPANQYKGIMDRLSLHRMGYRQQQIILPNRTRIVILVPKQLTQAWQRHTKTTRQLSYWPGMKANIAASIDTCMVCQTNKASLPRPTLTNTPPSSSLTLMRNIAMDLFDTAVQSRVWQVLCWQ